VATITQQPDTANEADTGRAAIAAAERGWAVFPCRPEDKRPAVDRWEQRACSDPQRIAKHWPEGANVGVACGPSGLVVVDLDRHGELPDDWRAIKGVHDGLDVFALLLEWSDQPWPDTYSLATPSGGQHLYFVAPGDSCPVRNSAGLLGPGVDVRAQGGYVVGAGSVVGGRLYELIDDRPPAVLPGWLCRRLAPEPQPAHPRSSQPGDAPANLAGLIETVRSSQPGQQTNTLVWAAFRLKDEIRKGRARIDDAEQLVEAALQAAMRPESYVRYQIRHVLGDTR
jgi:Bifunctional DNA primase/polymerase, N-terminal